jgi:hypothetical protein
MTIMRAQNDGPSPGGQAVQSGGRKQAEPRPRCGRNHTHANAPPRWLVAFENGGQAYSTLKAEENSTVRRTTPAYASCSCCRCTEKQRLWQFDAGGGVASSLIGAAVCACSPRSQRISARSSITDQEHVRAG